MGKKIKEKVEKKKEIIEIIDGDMVLKIPKDEDKISNALNILNSLLKQTSRKSLKDDLEGLKEELKKIEGNPIDEKSEEVIAQTEEEPLNPNIKKCPKCNKKLKAKSKKTLDGFERYVKCKKCGFEHTFNLKY